MTFLAALVGGELNVRLIVNFCANVNYVHRYLALQIPLEYRSLKRSRSIDLAPVIIWHSLTRSHRQCRILIFSSRGCIRCSCPFCHNAIHLCHLRANSIIKDHIIFKHCPGAVQYARSGKACHGLH